MQTVGGIIRAQRQALGLTLQQVADMVGCTKGYLSSIENNRRENPPSGALLQRIEGALRLPADRLVSVGRWQETPEPVRRRVLDLETDRHMARRLARLLAREGVDRLHRSGELQRLVERLEGDAPPESGKEGVVAKTWRALLPMQVPLINKVAAGYPAEFTDLGYPARVADEYVSVPEVSDPDAFAARVVGDSMEPQYREGDIVVFSPLAPTKNGSDCFIRFERNEESTFKRVFFEEGPSNPPRRAGSGTEGHTEGARIRLQPLNPAYPARSVDREAVAGMYAAVYVVRAIGGNP